MDALPMAAHFEGHRCPNCAASLNVLAGGGAHCQYCDWRREPALKAAQAALLPSLPQPSAIASSQNRPVQSAMLVHNEPWDSSDLGVTNELRPVLLLLSIATMSAVFCEKWWTSNIPYIDNDWAVRIAVGAIAGWWLSCAQLAWIRDGETHQRWLLTWTMIFIGSLFVWLAEP